MRLSRIPLLRPSKPSARAFVYVHGGSYISQINSGQWELVMELARRSGATCWVPIYELAPHATAEQTVGNIAAVVATAVAESGSAQVDVLGDSAGGGIAVAAAQQLRDAAAALPARLILLAPWLDATGTHPDQQQIARHDILARPAYLLDAARAYAGDLPLDDWRVSPLNGDVGRLPPMSVFTGSHDTVVTDSRRLVEQVTAAGGQIDYVEAAGMQHVYPILPLLGQARAARRSIAATLRG